MARGRTSSPGANKRSALYIATSAQRCTCVPGSSMSVTCASCVRLGTHCAFLELPVLVSDGIVEIYASHNGLPVGAYHDVRQFFGLVLHVPGIPVKAETLIGFLYGLASFLTQLGREVRGLAEAFWTFPLQAI